jgi:hypothetical protein
MVKEIKIASTISPQDQITLQRKVDLRSANPHRTPKMRALKPVQAVRLLSLPRAHRDQLPVESNTTTHRFHN